MNRSLALFALLVALAACGDETGSPEEEARPMSTPSETPAESAPTEDLTVSPTGKPGRTLELRGTVEPGTEAGCHLLSFGGTTYLLVGGAVTDGERVVVTGTVEPDLITTCQQGVPFRVAKVAPGD